MLAIDVERHIGAFSAQIAFASSARVTALFGRSGSGKTTLAHMIAGLLRPDRGRIEVEGRVLFDSATGTNVPPEHRRIGYVFQEGRLFPHFTVQHNLLYGYRLAAPAERYCELDRVVALLGLEHLLGRRPGRLSGGEKQRVAIGRALLSSPRLLLLDEPLASLDNYRKGEILQYIERLRDELGIPIVYVSHAIEEVTRLADNMVVLSAGRVMGAGTVSEIMSRLDLSGYTGRFEAGAVIEAKVAAHDLRYELTRLDFAGGSLYVANLDALIGEPVRVRVRARDVALAITPPAGTTFRNVVQGRISGVVEGEGPLAEVRVKAGDATIIARVTRHALHELRLTEGMTVYALIKAIALDRHSVGFA